MPKKPKLLDDQEACINCRFFLLDDPKDEAGYCRRGPKVFIYDDGDGGWSHSVNTPDGWCGDHDRIKQ